MFDETDIRAPPHARAASAYPPHIPRLFLFAASANVMKPYYERKRKRRGREKGRRRGMKEGRRKRRWKGEKEKKKRERERERERLLRFANVSTWEARRTS